MNDITPVELLDECKLAFRSAQANLISGAAMLYRIREENVWQGRFSSFSEYVEGELGITKGYASKLLNTFVHFCINGGVSQEKLEGTDIEKLYKASKLEGDPERQLLLASTLSRSELDEETREQKHGEHIHDLDLEKTSAPCKVCGKWERVTV